MSDENNPIRENPAKSVDLKTMLGRVVSKAKKQPVRVGGAVVCILFLAMMFSGESKVDQHPLVKPKIAFEEDKKQMVGVKESVDPRDVWTAQVEQGVKKATEELTRKLEESNTAKNAELAKMQTELKELKRGLGQQQEAISRKELEESLSLSNPPVAPVIIQKSSKSLGFFSKGYGEKKKNIKEYIPSGTFARAVLLSGVVVGTGTESQSNPEPITLRLTDAGIFSKGGRIEQIKEAILIGSCEGDLSSERAKCRLQTLSLENNKGEIIERQIEGWIFGEDGRNGIKGFVVDKSSDLMRMAVINGVLGGASSFLQSQSTKGIFPISPLTGQQNALSSASQLKSGAASGAGNAFSKLADFGIKRFDAMSPQIVIASERKVNVLFKKGVDLNGEFEPEPITAADGNLGVSNNRKLPATAQSKAIGQAMKQARQEMVQDEVGVSF